MRGSPPLHLVLFLVGFALLAVPLARLTFARPAASSDAQAKAATATTPTFIRLRFAHTPQRISLKHDGVELLPVGSSQPLASKIEARAALRLPPEEGIELLLSVTWPQGTPVTAVTVELEPDGKDAKSQTRWSSGASLNEVLNHQWK